MRRPRRAPAPLRTPAERQLTLRRRRRRPPRRQAGEPVRPARRAAGPAGPVVRRVRRRPGISRRPPRPALPRRRREQPGPGSRASPGASHRARVPLGQEGSGPARSPHRPPTPDRPPDPARTPTAAHLQGRRRRRAPKHGPPRTPRSAWSGQARLIRAHRCKVLPGRVLPGRPGPYRAPLGQMPPSQAPRNRQPPGPAVRDLGARGRPLGQGMLSRRCRRGRRRLRLTCLLGLGWLVSGLRGICWRSRSAWAGWPWCTGPPMSGWDGGSR